jgi:serine/threonine protein kinase
MADYVKDVVYPVGFGRNDVVAWGSTGLVVRDKASQTVIKTPSWEDDEPLMSREIEIYERLSQRGGHEGILRYYGTVEKGIRLEYAPNGDLRSFQKRQKDCIDGPRRLKWAAQIAEALDFVHEAGVIHGDLGCHNIFLDEHLNAKLADFAGSSLDGSELLVGVTPSHEYPGSALSTRGDIFTFGAVIYKIMAGEPPYGGLSEAEINSQYKNGEFADTVSFGEMGAIIRKCWTEKYPGFAPLAEDLRGGMSLSSTSWHYQARGH